jgi:hypothetical protein
MVKLSETEGKTLLESIKNLLPCEGFLGFTAGHGAGNALTKKRTGFSGRAAE